MIYLVLGILLSSMMTVCFKLADKFRINGDNIILVNYMVAALISVIMAAREGVFHNALPTLLDADFFSLLTEKTVPNTYLLLVLLGILSGFYFIIDLINIKNSIQSNGAGVSSLFGKFGFLITTLFAMLVWKEIPTMLQFGGIGLAVVAFVIACGKMNEAQNVTRPFLLLQLALFAGLAEINNKAAVYYAVNESYNSFYISVIFVVALVLAIFYVSSLNREQGRKFRLTWKDILGGVCTGLPNVVSNFFILKALETIPSNVYFPTSAAGNLVFCTLLSAVVFKERLTKRQLVSIGIMIVSLVLINI